MKFSKFLMIIALGGCSTLFSTDYYGYISSAVNNYPNSTLYIKNTDKNPGWVNKNTGSTILAIESGKAINDFNQYVLPWDKFGGKIYVWLVDNSTNKIINALKMYDKDDTFSFVTDTELKPAVQQQPVNRPKIACNVHTDANKDAGTASSDSMKNAMVSINAQADGNITFGYSCVDKPAEGHLAADIAVGALEGAAMVAGSGGGGAE